MSRNPRQGVRAPRCGTRAPRLERHPCLSPYVLRCDEGNYAVHISVMFDERRRPAAVPAGLVPDSLASLLWKRSLLWKKTFFLAICTLLERHIGHPVIGNRVPHTTNHLFPSVSPSQVVQ